MTRQHQRAALQLSTVTVPTPATKRKTALQRRQQLDRVEDALTHLNRIINGRAADRRFFAFFLLLDFDFLARGIITSVLPIHSVGTALQSQEPI